MVNASLNWASIVGIALAICGGGLYFLRSFKPALARDYDVFFAAIGLLCGGILFFQGWRLDPILQFGQFLLAGTTVFFAYESVRLRGIATDQARRSTYFDDEYETPPSRSNPGFRSRNEDNFNRFEESQPLNRRFRSIDDSDYESDEDEFYTSRKTSRAAIPEQAASRRNRLESDPLKRERMESRRMARFSNSDADAARENRGRSNFGDRRTIRQEEKRGSRPRANNPTPRTGRNDLEAQTKDFGKNKNNFESSSNRYSPPKGISISSRAEDAAYTSPSTDRSNKRRSSQSESKTRRRSMDGPNRQPQSRRSNLRNSNSRDNTSRFDD